MMTTELPNGYWASALLPEHEQSAIEAMNAAFRWMNGGNLTSLAEMQVEWTNPGFNRETDTQVVIAPDGTVAGYIDMWDITSLHVRWFSMGYVHPEHMGRGVGSYLVNWSKERACQNLSQAPADARVVLHQGQNSTNRAAYELFMKNGYREARHAYRMRIDLDHEPQAPCLIDGIEIRSIETKEEERAAIQTAYEAFHDHWGFVEEPFEAYYKRWAQNIEHDPQFDPSLYFIALDKNEIAGVSLCYTNIEEDPEMGWVGTLGVRRAWRKQGLGLALLRHSFREFYRRGKARAGLGVDAENLTGALRLYEKAGLRVWRKNTTYEYELRPGKDYMKQAL